MHLSMFMYAYKYKYKYTGPQCVVCAPAHTRSDTTISRGRSRLYGQADCMQHNARHTRIAWPSISLATAGRCSQIYAIAACASMCATRTNTLRKLTIAWCHDHVVCRKKSAHEGAPSGRLFNEQKGQEFIFFESSTTSSNSECLTPVGVRP
jgi:hypothetical protein